MMFLRGYLVGYVLVKAIVMLIQLMVSIIIVVVRLSWAILLALYQLSLRVRAWWMTRRARSIALSAPEPL